MLSLESWASFFPVSGGGWPVLFIFVRPWLHWSCAGKNAGTLTSSRWCCNLIFFSPISCQHVHFWIKKTKWPAAFKLCIIFCLRVQQPLRIWWIYFLNTLFTFSCSNKGIKDMSTRCLWFIQTFLFGFASLHLLIKYDPERSKQDWPYQERPTEQHIWA